MARHEPFDALFAQPGEVASREFGTARRGFDRHEVRAYLRAIGASLEDAQRREAEMRVRLGKAVRRAEKAEAKVRDALTVEQPELTRQLGDEVTTVLDAAEVAAQQKIAAAEKSAEQIMANARAEATRLRRTADAALARHEAEAAKSVEALRADARRDARRVRNDAADALAKARDEGEQLVSHAEAARREILQDMDRRRRQARAQIERLRVGRDRLLRSYEVVRRNLDESTVELKSSLREAKVLGDSAARKTAAEPPASDAALEAEVVTFHEVRAPRPEPVGTTERIELPRVELPETASARPAEPRPPAIAPLIRLPLPDRAPDHADTDDVEDDAGTDNAAGPEDFSDLPDGELAIIDPSDEIEEVVAVPVASGHGLFDALRAQFDPAEVQRQLAAIVDEIAPEIEARLRTAVADEQNDVLAGIRGAGKSRVDLISFVGETDDHVARYVQCVTEPAATAYAAGAALLDADVSEGEMPAGAVEELLATAIVLPIRLRLLELDGSGVDMPSIHVDQVRAFYRQRKQDHMSDPARQLATLLVSAGACDAGPEGGPAPWLTTTTA